MRAQFTSRLIIGACFGVAVVAGTAAVSAIAQSLGAPERYDATAVNLGDIQTNAGRVIISVDTWTTPKDRARLLAVLNEKGPDELLSVLQDSPKAGYLRLPTTLAWDLRYAYQSPMPDGGRRVVLVTDRPIGFQEARNQPRRIEYPFTLIEIHFPKSGPGVGKMSVYTKISVTKDKKSIELENYDIEPVRLTEVRIEKTDKQ
jgi:hypothetical protein